MQPGEIAISRGAVEMVSVGRRVTSKPTTTKNGRKALEAGYKAAFKQNTKAARKKRRDQVKKHPVKTTSVSDSLAAIKLEDNGRMDRAMKAARKAARERF